MTWQELSQAVASGRIELQSHSAQLHVYRTRKGVQLLPEETAQAYEAMLLSDMEQMDQWSRAAGITMLRAFAYPYGYVEPLADALLQQQGYVATMTSEPHLNLITEPLSVPRGRLIVPAYQYGNVWRGCGKNNHIPQGRPGWPEDLPGSPSAPYPARTLPITRKAAKRSFQRLAACSFPM